MGIVIDIRNGWILALVKHYNLFIVIYVSEFKSHKAVMLSNIYVHD